MSTPEPGSVAAELVADAICTERALSLWQPWASLIALGVKTIETRSWNTYYRGPLAIHAAKRKPEQVEHGYLLARYDHDIGEPPTPWALLGAAPDHGPWPVHLGAVVATCTLVDVVPMKLCGDRHPNKSSLILDMPHDGDLPQQAGGMWLIGPNDLTHGRPTRVEDQRPYGDYRPGRFAWLLADIRPVDPPVTMRGHQGLWRMAPPVHIDGGRAREGDVT